MKTIARSTLLALPSDNALPAFDQGELRDYTEAGPVKVWIAADGVACCLMWPHQAEAEFSNDGTPGEWLAVELDEPTTDESEATVAARNWLAKFLAS